MLKMIQSLQFVVFIQDRIQKLLGHGITIMLLVRVLVSHTVFFYWNAGRKSRDENLTSLHKSHKQTSSHSQHLFLFHLPVSELYTFCRSKNECWVARMQRKTKMHSMVAVASARKEIFLTWKVQKVWKHAWRNEEKYWILIHMPME